MPASRKRDYYEVLGVARDVGAAELKAAYRTLALRYHPDKNPDDQVAEERFKEVSEAYAVLADPERRARYDHLGHAGVGSVAGTGFDVQDLFDGIVGAFRGGARKGRGERARPRDVRYKLELTFEEAVLGCQKSIRFDAGGECPVCRGTGGRPGAAVQRCAACNGTGEIRVKEGFFRAARTCGACKGRGKLYATRCEQCSGSGRASRPREFIVRIPPGSEDGNVRIVRGAGESGVSGKTGDLHIILKVTPHPLLEREGHDLTCEVPISFTEAALGASIEVPTLEGKVRMKVPAGTQSGKVFRLRGKGLPRGSTRGDQHVRVVVETPASLSGRERRLIEELAAAEADDGLPQRRSFVAKMRALYKD